MSEQEDHPDTRDYRDAPSGIGPLAGQWQDKPHRLVYDLCREVDRLRRVMAETVAAEREACAKLAEGHANVSSLKVVAGALGSVAAEIRARGEGEGRA